MKGKVKEGETANENFIGKYAISMESRGKNVNLPQTGQKYLKIKLNKIPVQGKSSRMVVRMGKYETEIIDIGNRNETEKIG